MPKHYIALIPAYKPSEVLMSLVYALYENMDVVVVDDGSGAAYSKLFHRCAKAAHVLYQEKNCGKGAALKTGLSFIAEHYGTKCVVVTVDADGQHAVAAALAVAKTADEHPNALVLGSRKFTGKVPLRSRFGNTLTRWVYRASSGVYLQDTQTGLRAFCGDMIVPLLSIPGERYEYEMNVLLSFAKQKIPMMEQEIETIYENNNASSHFDPIKDSIRIYSQILKFSASSFVGFLVDYLLYSLLVLLTDHLLFSNVCARVVSASVNFTLNRKFVFKSNSSLAKSAVKYFLLAVGILAGNTLLLSFFVNACGINLLVAKILTEVLFFLCSWILQKTVVFRR